MNRKARGALLAFGCIPFAGARLSGQQPADQTPPSPQQHPSDSTATARLRSPKLFESDEVLELTLAGDLKAVAKERGTEKHEYPAALSYVAPGGDSLSLNVRLKTRGHFRLQRRICDFPPLKVAFDRQQVSHTVFAGQGSLKLATHCQNNRTFEQYLLEEYLIYRLYTLLTEKSFRVRLARVTYMDTGGEHAPLTKYAFFIEDDDRVARRNRAQVLSQQGFNQPDTDFEQMGLVAVFQYMIGNTDWSVRALHNIVLIRDSAGVVLTVPYDFDWSGVIWTSYAHPDPILGIKTVRERLFRGYCRTADQLAPTFARFNERKDAIYALYRSQAGVEPKRIEQALRYYDEFYRTINDPRMVKREFIQACQG